MGTTNITRIEGEPIIHAKATGHITIENLLEVYQCTAELRVDMPKNIYRITEFTDVQTTFTDMMGMMREAVKRGGSSSLDPSVTVVFVGTIHWVKLFTDALRQGAFGNKIIPVFDNFDAALSFVREDIAMNAAEG